MKRHIQAFLIPFLVVSCGGSSPTAPTTPAAPPTPTPVTDLRNGITGAAVAGTVTPSAGRVTITASGLLTREQDAANPVWLWPQSEDYVQATVYTIASTVPHSVNLLRWAPGSTIRLALGPTLTGDPQAEAKLQSAASELARWSHLPVVIGLPASVTLEIDPAATAAASPTALGATYWQFSGSTVVGARVVFRDRETAVAGQRGNTMLHELGHVLGLAGHSPIVTDAMSQLNGRNSSQFFGGDEAAALTMMYLWRRAGNQFPDRALAGTAAARYWTAVVVD